ncbi:MAG: FAD-dependent monooxygenase [Rubrivivax sp.]|jgi:ubiquinone biosynthesis UbiH/UbiF/VisC/COQ6 family hydroxylase|nr:FAD-dependent monooxygenase [Rubrivivax sp.]
MSRFDLCVRGSGAVALSAALALARQGLSVALQAREPTAAADVRTYALNTGAVRLLSSLKVWDALPADARTPVYDMQVEGDAGAALHFSAWQQHAEQLAFIVDAAELESALRAAVRFAPHLTRVDEPVDAPLQVLADGKASASRAGLGVGMPLHRYGQRAVAARLVAAQPHGGLARQWFRSPDVLALLPFDRPEPGCSYGLVWSVPDERADELMALDDTAFEQQLADATAGEVGALRLAAPRAEWPLMIGRADALCGPGWVLLGDAAHVVHPLAGQGLNLGLADVAVLAEVIAAREPWRGLGDPRLLQRYARRRDLPVRAMSHVTDGLLHLFASPQPVLRELRNRGLTLVDRLAPVKRFLTARALDA